MNDRDGAGSIQLCNNRKGDCGDAQCKLVHECKLCGSVHSGSERSGGGCDEHEYQRYRNLESTGTRSSARCVGTFGDSVCYAIEGNVVDRNNSQNGKGWCENVSPTLNIQDRHAVVYRKAALIIYPIENHPADSHIVLQEPGSAIQTLNARMGTGGGNTPIVLMAVGGTDSHASITDGNVAPTMLARAGTGGQRTNRADGE